MTISDLGGVRTLPADHSRAHPGGSGYSAILVTLVMATGCTSATNPGAGPDARTDAGAEPDGRARMGWQLDSSNTGLAPLGLVCADLARYTGPSRPPAGSTIREQRIEHTLDLSAGAITIERSCIRPTSVDAGLPVITTTDNNNCQPNGGSCAPPPRMVTIRDSEIDGSAVGTEEISKAAAFLGIATIERTYIHDVGSGIAIANSGDHLDAIVQGNYVHRLRAFGDPAGDGSHTDGFTIRDFEVAAHPERRAIVRGNRFDCSSGNDTGALFIQTTFGNIDQVLVTENLLEGDGYQLALEAGNGSIYGMSVSAINNRFTGTGYGPAYVTARGLGYGWHEWTDNYINDQSAADNKGRPVPNPSP